MDIHETSRGLVCYTGGWWKIAKVVNIHESMKMLGQTSERGVDTGAIHTLAARLETQNHGTHLLMSCVNASMDLTSSTDPFHFFFLFLHSSVQMTEKIEKNNASKNLSPNK